MLTRPNYLLLLLFIFSAFSANAQRFQQKQFYLLEDSTRQLTAQNALQMFTQNRFVAKEGYRHNPGFTKSIFWLAFTMDADVPKDSVVLLVGDHHINRLDLYKYNGDSLSLLNVTGDFFPFEQRPLETTNFYFPVTQKGIYIVRVEKWNESLQLFFGLSSYVDVIKEEASDTSTMALFTGIILLLIIFGAYLFLISRDKLYLLYILYIACGWCWVLGNSGHGFRYIWPDAPWFASKARPLFSVLTITLSLHFMTAYIGGIGNRYMERFMKFSRYLFLAVAAGILIWTDNTSKVWYYSQVSVPLLVLVYIICILALLSYKAITGNKLAIFYLVAVSTLIGLILLQVAFYTGNLHQDQGFLSKFGVAVGYISESVILTAGLVFRFNEYRLEKEKLLKEMNRRQMENIRILMDVQEAERNQIANQLHDVTGSLLSAAKLNLSSLREKELREDESLRLEKTEEAVTLVSETVRNLSHALSPVMLNKVGFKTALEKVVSIFNASGKINIRLVVVGFDVYQEELNNYYTSIYGIVYELLNNIVKHASAKHALVQLVEHDDSYNIIVEDDGVGVDPTVSFMKNTHGLAGIISKIEYFKGHISFDKNEPKGLIITIEIPKKNYAL